MTPYGANRIFTLGTVQTVQTVQEPTHGEICTRTVPEVQPSKQRPKAFAGPTAGTNTRGRCGNCHATCLFRSTARTKGEAPPEEGLVSRSLLTAVEPQIVVQEHRGGKLAGSRIFACSRLVPLAVLLVHILQPFPSWQDTPAGSFLQLTRHYAIERNLQPSAYLGESVCSPKIVVVEARSQKQVQRLASNSPRFLGIGEPVLNSLCVTVQPPLEILASAMRYSAKVELLPEVRLDCPLCSFWLAADSADTDGVNGSELLNQGQQITFRDLFQHRFVSRRLERHQPMYARPNVKSVRVWEQVKL